MHCREEWGEDGFGRIAMMPDNTYGTCFMYHVRAASRPCCKYGTDMEWHCVPGQQD